MYQLMANLWLVLLNNRKKMGPPRAKLFLFTVILIVLNVNQSMELTISNSGSTLLLDVTEDGIDLKLTLEEEEKLVGTIGRGQKVTAPDDCSSTESCILQGNDVELTIDIMDSGFRISWLTNNTDLQFQDCFSLQADKVHWFGGPETYNSQWPVENMKFSNLGYRSSRIENRAISERYWLSSKGAYIFIDDKVPLFLDQNNENEGSICFGAKQEPPYYGRQRILLQYSIVAKDDAREAHLHAVENYLGKPTGHPNEWIIKKPIWTTWAEYKKDISDEIVLNFAKDIAQHGFQGQIEIDDFWETCYGTATFNERFANIAETVKAIKDLGFTVTLWTHPFVNHECEDVTNFGRENGFFVVNITDSDFTSWWNSNQAHHIDFTNEDARKWFTERLRKIQEDYGIDSFKFDAGETDWAPDMARLSGDIEDAPNSLTRDYIRTCATFGDLIEVRSSWRTQDLPVLVRMQDKDSRWGLDNGLQSLVTTLLQMNLVGYPLVLPDMIGGNGYGNDRPTPEILVRWTQANTFMPVMQFSYLPWELAGEQTAGTAIVKKYVTLHEQYADHILSAINASIANGTPVNPPIWWVDPKNPDALKSNDEFLLGEDILVAPVLTKGATFRDVVIPQGVWKDGHSEEIYEGPTIIKEYPATIDILPYFTRVSSV